MTRYEVKLKDQAGGLVALLTDWQRLDYNIRLNEPGDHALILDGDDGRVNLFATDGQLEIMAFLEDNITQYLDYEGFHRTGVRQTTNDGNSLFTSYGVSYLDLLARRVVLYYPHQAGAAKGDFGETVIKEYVEENAGPSATDPPRILRSGVMPGLTVEPTANGGLFWQGERSYRNLLEVVQDVGLATGVDFNVLGNGPAAFEFQARAKPWGADRTTAGLNPNFGQNAAGNPPVVFALGFANMGAPVYSLNRRQEKTVAIVLGRGSGSARTLRERVGAGAVGSPWNEIEIARQSNEIFPAALDAVGDKLLEELQAKESFSFHVIQTPAYLYRRDYFLGDLVTARYGTIERNKQIVGVSVTVAEGREDISVELSDI